jgi:hypothetical protein
MAGGDGPEVVTQESLLLGAAERINRIRDGRVAVHVHLSRLRPQNRQDGHVRIALRTLEPIVNAYRGQMFLLGNSDIVFMMKDPNTNDLENMIFKLRALFSKDPLTFNDAGDGRDNFCTWYELGNSEDYESFVEMSRAATFDARKRLREKVTARPDLQSIDAKRLGDLLARLSNMDVAPLVRRQASIVITAESRSVVLFQEFFVAMAELQRVLAPDINLMGNRWLFQHLSQTLDHRVLTALREMRLRATPPAFSLNLNISTVAGPDFQAFEERQPSGKTIFIELQVLDVLADSRGYYTARQRLRDAGHQVVIDGLSELTLQFLDIAQFDADLYKVTWSPEMSDGDHGDSVANALEAVDEDKLLLARCDSEAAISWGLSHGVKRFQGRYVDSMLAAYTMHGCDKSSACTLQQCTNRHAVIVGPLRAECGNNDMLDSSPAMTAPKVRNRQETN